jgi:hypothetical protein
MWTKGKTAYVDVNADTVKTKEKNTNSDKKKDEKKKGRGW